MNSSPYDRSNVFAVDTATGQEVWSFEADSSIVSSPVISGEIVYITDTSGKLYALDKQNGTKKWEFSDTDGGIQSILAVTTDSISFVGSQKVYSINKDGNEIWNYDIGYNFTSDVAASKEELYVGSEDLITGIDLKNGTARWQIKTDDAAEGIPAISGKKIYIGDNSGKLYSIRRKNTNSTDKSENNTENQSVEDTNDDTQSPSGSEPPTNDDSGGEERENNLVWYGFLTVLATIIALISHFLNIVDKLKDWIRNF